MASSMHDKRFSDETMLKLALFRKYTREWLPVALHQKGWNKIHIYDFFSGPGTDNKNNEGSPLILIDEVNRLKNILNKSVTFHFNDIKKENIEKLRNLINERHTNCQHKINYSTKDFLTLFEEEHPSIRSRETMNLLIIDQYGFGQIDEETFIKLARCRSTDFMFFISSSQMKRFSELPCVKKILPCELNLSSKPHSKIHKIICKEYEKLIPDDSDFHLIPFSIKKKSNINGIVFGSGNELGWEKFLTCCWKLDKESGEANYDVETGKLKNDTMSFAFYKPKRIDEFETWLEGFLKEGNKTNKDVYRNGLLQGFIQKHCNKALSKLKAEKRLEVREIEGDNLISRGFFIEHKPKKTVVFKLKG